MNKYTVSPLQLEVEQHLKVLSSFENSIIDLDRIFISLHTLKGIFLDLEKEEIVGSIHKAEEQLLLEDGFCGDLAIRLAFIVKKISNFDFSSSQEKLSNRLVEYVESKINKISKELGIIVDFHSFVSDIEFQGTQFEDLKILIHHVIVNSCSHGFDKKSYNRLSLRVKTANSGTYFELKDNGSGFDVDQFSQIRATSKASADYFSGRGVGMTVIKSKADDLGSKILIESSSFGTTVSFEVPTTRVNTEQVA